MKCESCGHENPSGKVFCENCGNKIVLRQNVDPDEESVKVLLLKIEALERELLARQTEIENMQNEINRVSKEKNELMTNHPEVKATLQKLDEKERQLETALQDLDRLHEELRDVPQSQPEPDLPASGTQLVIKAYPIKRSEFDVTLAHDRQSLDLSTTQFHIRASLERTQAGFELVVHDGATINVQAPGSKRWQRYAGGARVSAGPGMVFFDAKGIMNARLEQSS
jgi:DNA repair exonuclease SbcCD ATPase subunit